MNILKVFFGEESGDEYKRRVFSELTSEFEAQSISFGQPTTGIVDTAKRVRDMLLAGKLALKKDEKIKLVKLMNKAKVRALMSENGDGYGYEVFRSLDSISSDVTRLL